MLEHQPRLLGSRVRFPAGAFAIFSVSAKASLPISLSPFPSSFFPFLFLSLPLPLPSTFRLRFKISLFAVVPLLNTISTLFLFFCKLKGGWSGFFFFFLLSIAKRNGSKPPPPDMKVLSFVRDVRNFEMNPYNIAANRPKSIIPRASCKKRILSRKCDSSSARTDTKKNEALSKWWLLFFIYNLKIVKSSMRCQVY